MLTALKLKKNSTRTTTTVFGGGSMGACCLQKSKEIHEGYTELFVYCVEPMRVFKFKKNPMLKAVLGHQFACERRERTCGRAFFSTSVKRPRGEFTIHNA